MARICSCVGKPGSVSLDMSTSLPSAASHICAIVSPILRNLSLYSREFGVFHPKCHTDVCGPVSSFCGVVATFVNRLKMLPVFTASKPLNVVAVAVCANGFG